MHYSELQHSRNAASRLRVQIPLIVSCIQAAMMTVLEASDVLNAALNLYEASDLYNGTFESHNELNGRLSSSSCDQPSKS